jgi:hypothetical protein
MEMYNFSGLLLYHVRSGYGRVVADRPTKYMETEIQQEKKRQGQQSKESLVNCWRGIWNATQGGGGREGVAR